MELKGIPETDSRHPTSELVCLHFDDGTLPQLTRWELRWQQNQQLLARQEARQGHGFHWNVTVVSLCLALVRLELSRGQPTPLLRGARGTAVGNLAHALHCGEEEADFSCLLERPESATAEDVALRLHQWFNVVNGNFRQERPALIYAGSQPPDRVMVRLGGRILDLAGLQLLESKLAWMTEERDWIGAVMRPGVPIAA